MGFRFKRVYLGNLLFCLILFGNFWIWKALSLSLPIFILLVASSVLAYGLIKGRGGFSAFLFLVLLLVFSQWRTTSPTSLTTLSNDDIRLRDQRLKEYPPVFIKIGERAIWIPVGHWFEQRPESIASSRLAINLSEILDPNLYFFANHPRERVGLSEFGKLPYVLFPFFLVGILISVGIRRSKTFFLSFVLAALSLVIFGNKNQLGPFTLFPYIVSLSAIGGEYIFQKARGLVQSPK